MHLACVNGMKKLVNEFQFRHSEKYSKNVLMTSLFTYNNNNETTTMNNYCFYQDRGAIFHNKREDNE